MVGSNCFSTAPGSPTKQGRKFSKQINNIKTKQKENPSCLVHRGSLPHVCDGRAAVLTDADGSWGSGALSPRHPRESSPRSCTTWAAHMSGVPAGKTENEVPYQPCDTT